MDKITSNNVTVNGGKIDVGHINLLSPTKEKELSLLFTNNKDLAKTVTYTGEGTIAYSPIYKYETSYDVNKADQFGYFTFRVPGGSKPTPEQFNPSVLASPVTTQAAAQSTLTNTFTYAFEHGETFMTNPALDRFAMINSNVYALSTDYNDNDEHIDIAHENKGVWVKPYATFENIQLKNGPKVDAINYGTLVGFDSKIHKLKRGWSNVGTAYIGYNGSQIDYSGVDTSTNGGLVGVTETFYKGNLWTAVTASVGATNAESHTMYGKEDSTALIAGVASKTGYNFEFNEGKFIIQPRMMLSYSMVNTFDYTNAAGVKIDNDPMHTIQINPAIKFIGNIKGWQPYASVGMTWNLLNETEANANGVKLPEMHTKPYVEYGVGVQRTWADKYSAYGQAMVRNGGRTGVAMTFGFRWALGDEGKPIEKVQNPNVNKNITTEAENISNKLGTTQYRLKTHTINSTRTASGGNFKKL